MTNARDKANIPVLNFQSKGIDDNADATAITINSSEQVGIGETSPLGKLHVKSADSGASANSGHNQVVAENSANSGISILSGNTSNGAVCFGDDGNNCIGFVNYAHDGNHLDFGINGTEKMRITSAGNVGIGTTSPAENLQVMDTGSNIPKIRIETSDGGNKRLDLSIESSVGTIASSQSTQQLAFKTAGGEAVRIDATGKVGIGTSAPDSPLDILTSGNSGLEVNAGTGSAHRIYLGNTGGTSVVGTLSNHAFATITNGSERMRITSAGSVGIGETAPLGLIHAKSADSGVSSVNDGANELIVENSGDAGITIASGSTSFGKILFADSSNNADGQILYDQNGRSLRFSTAGSERMRIDSSGNVLVAQTAQDLSVVGISLNSNGNITATRAGGTPALFNRQTNDGTVISIRQANTEEGGIDVTGSTVSFNGFTGTHWSRFANNSTPTILRGTVLESLDEMCDWYNLHFDTTNEQGKTIPQVIPHVLEDGQSDGDIITYNHEGTDYQATITKEADIKHMKSKVSDTVDAKNVYGVFNTYDNNYEEGYNDFYVASVGSFVVRIKANETIAKGDLLQSNGDGTAKVQIDDNVKSSSFAKVLSTTIIETYEDGSYLVPCSLNC